MGTLTPYGEMSFSQNLLKALSHRGLTQANLAVRTGISPSAISEMTSDKRRPYLDQAILIATALDISLDMLAANEEIQFQEDAKPSEDEQAVAAIVRKLGPDESLKRLLRPPGPVFGPAVGAQTETAKPSSELRRKSS